MCEQPLPRPQVRVIWLQQCTMLESAVLTLGLLRFQLHFSYLQRYLVSFVRGSCVLRLCCRFHSQESGMVSVVVIFKIEVARDFYVTKQRISISWGVCRLLGCSRRALSASLRLLTVACAWIASPRGIKLSLRTCRSNLSVLRKASTSRRPSLKSPFRL